MLHFYYRIEFSTNTIADSYMNHILVEDNRDMSMPSDMSLFLYIWISENGAYSVLICYR